MEKLYYVSQNSGFAYTSLEKAKVGLREVVDNWVDQATYGGDPDDLSEEDAEHESELLAQIEAWTGNEVLELKCNFECDAFDNDGESDANWTCLAGDMIIICDV